MLKILGTTINGLFIGATRCLDLPTPEYFLNFIVWEAKYWLKVMLEITKMLEN
jgi:hypothetical protein